MIRQDLPGADKKPRPVCILASKPESQPRHAPRGSCHLLRQLDRHQPRASFHQALRIEAHGNRWCAVITLPPRVRVTDILPRLHLGTLLQHVEETIAVGSCRWIGGRLLDKLVEYRLVSQLADQLRPR